MRLLARRPLIGYPDGLKLEGHPRTVRDFGAPTSIVPHGIQFW